MSYLKFLSNAFIAQTKFSSKFMDIQKVKSDNQYSQIWALQNIDDCIEELIEVRKELPYRKYWSSKKLVPFVKAKVLEELADVLCFFINLCISLGVSEDELCEAYMLKSEINVNRQKENY